MDNKKGNWTKLIAAFLLVAGTLIFVVGEIQAMDSKEMSLFVGGMIIFGGISIWILQQTNEINDRLKRIEAK